MSKKELIITAVLALVMIAVIFTGRKIFVSKNFEVRRISAPILTRAKAAQDPQVYDIKKVKSSDSAAPGPEVTDLESLYKNYPPEKAGDNMIAGWAKVNPEDKAKLMKGLAETIEKSKAQVKSDPANRKARSKLIISEMLQKLTSSDFKCKFK